MKTTASTSAPHPLPISGSLDDIDIDNYVHGYSTHESRRLADQADALSDRLHHDTTYPAGAKVLEVGCGVGAQTVHLVVASPEARFTAVDVSAASLALARARVTAQVPEAQVTWLQTDLFEPPFPDAEFDHVFVCFVLEHLASPHRALAALRRVLRPGGTLTVIEGDHGSAFFHPDSPYARAAVDCLVQLQSTGGGNALVGRQLHPLLTASGYDHITVHPRTVYTDRSRPALVKAFTLDTFTAMIESVREDALAADLTTPVGLGPRRRRPAPHRYGRHRHVPLHVLQGGGPTTGRRVQPDRPGHL
ncbi:L-histidine N(alpha)-methyltransferase [Streptomyces sp. NPDC057474]|uniref:L-histidine N(alpha)-methyltransferase n=1 Tax=Streptomyces sp. NPDC057474 TaxID=3346144 RepID=UPI0036B840A5